MISTIDESLTTKGSQEILAFQRSCAQETDMTSPLLNSLINSQDTENSFEENGNFIGKRQTKMSLLAPKRDFGSCLTSAKRFKPSEETGFEPDYSADSNRASTPLKDNLNNSQVLDNHNPDKVDGFQNNSNSDSLSSFYYYYLNNSNNSHNNHHLINNADTSIDVRHISPNISIKNNSYLNPNNTYESYLNSILTPSALSSSAHSTPVASSASVSAKNSNMSRSASSKNVFGCAVCAYVSNCAAKIKLHVAVHASEKLYNCSECGKRSYWSWDISKHIKAKHPSHTSEDSMGIVNKPVPHIVKSIQALKEIEELNKLPIRVMKREDLMAGLHMGAGVPVNSNCEMGWGNDSSASYQGNNPQSGTTGGSQENASFGQNPNSAIHSTLPNTYTSYFNSPVLVFRCKFCSFKDPSRSLAESHVKSTHGYSIAPPKGPPADLLTLDSNAIMPVVDNYYERPAASFSTSLLSLTNPTSSYHSNQHPPQTTHQTGQSGGHGRRGAGVANSLTTTAAGNPRTNVYPCPVCPFISNKHSAFKRHTELHTFPPPRVDGNGVEAVTPHVGPYYKCPFCPYFVPLKRMLWQHLRMHVPNPQEILNRLSAYDPENDVRQPIPPNVDALSNTFAPNNRDNPNLTIADNSIVDQREDEAKDGDSKDFDLSNADGMNGSADDMAGNPTPKSEDFNHKNNEDVAEVATSICEAVACTREIKVEEESVCDDRSSDSIAKMTTTIISTNRRKSRAPSSLTSMLKAAAALSCPNPNPPIPLLPDCQMSAPTVLPDPIPITPSQPSLVITPQYVPPLPIMTPQYVPSSPITPLPLSPVITPQYVPPAPVITPQYVAPALVITPQYVQPTPVIIPQYVPPSPVTTPQYVPPHQAVENQTHISKFNDEIERNAPPSKPPKPCKWDKDDEKEITAAWGLKLGKYVRMFKCPYCPHLGTRRANVRLHIKLHGIREGMKGKLQKCPKCSFNCANPTRFSNHLNMHGIYADNRQTATDASRPPNTDFPSTDTGPNLGSSSQSRTQNNEIKSESDIQNCQASTVTDPVENVSSNSSPRLGLTNRPQDDFTQDGNILTSTPSNSDDKYDLKCPKCPAKFCLQRMFKKHMKFHGRKFKLHCQDCDYTCPKIYQLVRHVKLHNVTILPSSSSTLLPIFNARFPDSKIATSESLSVPVPQNSSNTQLPGTSPQISDRQIQSLRAKNLVVAIDLANSNKCFTSSIPKLELTPLCISDINNALDKPVISETEKGELTDQNSTPPLVNTFEKAFDYYHPDMARFLTIEHPSAKLNGPTTISYECQNCAFKSTSRCAIEKHCSFHVGKRDIFCQFCNYSARKKAPFEKHVEYHFDMQHNFFAKTNYFMKQEESLIDAIDGFDHSRAFKSNSGKRLPKHDPPNKRLDINGLTNNSDAKNMEVKSPLPEKNAPFCYCPHCGRNFENLTSETSQTNDSPKNPDGELSLLSHKTFHISACGYCFSLPSQPPSTQTADPNTSSSPAIPNSNDSKSSSNNERGDQNNNHCHNNHSKSDNNILSDKGGDGETDSPNFFYRYDSIGRRRKIFYSSTRIVSDGHSRSHSHNKHSFVGGSPGGNLLLNKVGGIQARVDVGSANIFSSFTSE
ncbi:uncharacterized protein LOC135927851 [Gordionus sp. m RMFG-2023]|uniref:uncharacterized protein LOC135927851 n=1 Tax=Gordionus sp. m RMFG-2023 TaxID=3053472 RepID=UPI0031FD5238